MKTALLRLCVVFVVTYLLAVSAHGDEVWTEVTEVEPILEERRVAPKDPACQASKPSRPQGLAALLQWDVGTECRYKNVTATRAYRVHYRWAGKDYSYVSRTLPQQRIKLDVEVYPD